MDRETIDTVSRNRCIIGLLLLPLFVYGESLFEAGLHGGLAGWTAQPVYVNRSVGLHAGAQLYYSYLSPSVFGFRTGVTFDRHAAYFCKQNYEDGYSTVDVEDDQMVIDYTIGSLWEQHSMWSVGVPVQLALTYRRFTLYAGPKVVFPFSGKWKQEIKQAALSVYYPDYENRVYDSYPLAASSNFEQNNNGSTAFPKVQWWLAAELNYALPLNTWATHYRSYLMVGVYFDYCLTRVAPARSEAECLIMLTDTRDGLPLQRLYTSVAEGQRQGRKMVNNYAMFDVGIKLSYAISPFDAHKAARKSCNCRNW